MSFDRLRDTWDSLGGTDPLWAVLSDPDKSANRWDIEEFFETGKHEIEKLFSCLDDRGLTLARRRCLDFGCGVGRLSQALCASFDSVDGVDIAKTMVERARSYNRFGERCRYHLNTRADLRLFADASFDLVYSIIVLQHMEPDLAEGYIGEFVRVLAHGGLAVFQVPSDFLGFGKLAPGSHRAELKPELIEEPLQVLPGAARTISVKVMNASGVNWSTTSRPPVFLKLGNHWLDEAGSMVTHDDGRSRLLGDHRPGEETRVEILVRAPSRPGRYILELDLVEEGSTWFAARGSQTCRISVEVTDLSKSLTFADAIRRAIRRRGPAHVAPPSPPAFEMHALSRDRVETAIGAAGGELVAIEESDVSGAGWENYRYFVRKT